jgi:predicted MFS family arabinose efflux permease
VTRRPRPPARSAPRRSRRSAPRRSRQSALWRDRRFCVFLTSQTLSVAGDSFALIAVPLLILRATGSVAQMGLLTGAAGAAAVVAGIFAGILVDRLDRWILMAACDLARMLLYGLIPLVWSIHPEVWLLYVILPLCAAIGMVFQVGYVTVVPVLSGPARITEANGLLYGAASAAAIAGPLLAGLVSAALGPAGAIAVDAASFAASAVGILLVRRSLSVSRTGAAHPAVSGGRIAAGCSAMPAATGTPGTATGPDRDAMGTPDSADEPGRGGSWRELLAGARFLWQQPVLRALTVLLTFFIFATEGLPDVLIFYIKHDLGQGDGVVGAVLAFAGLGTVVGALAVAPLRRRLGFGTCWVGSVLLCGLAIGGLGATGSVPPTAALAALYLGCTSVAGIASMSLRQQVTPDHLLGRVTAAFWTIHFSLGPIGAALLTWTASRFGVEAACAASAALCFLLGAAALLTPVRQRSPEPVPAGA